MYYIVSVIQKRITAFTQTISWLFWSLTLALYLNSPYNITWKNITMTRNGMSTGLVNKLYRLTPYYVLNEV